jgi:mevalonate kinase
MTEASAPSKIILCGEHAVVYGRPAIALPLSGVRAHAVVQNAAPGSGITFDAPDLGQRWTLTDEPDLPFSELVVRMLAQLGVTATLDLQISMASTIPIAGGMGSGAAIATAIVRALAAHLGHELPAETISALVYASEQRFHGTPSGIDNTVVAFERPIWFVRQPTADDRRPTTDKAEPRTENREPANNATRNTQHATRNTQHATRNTQHATIEPITIAEPFTLLIGDTGVRSPTRLPVGEVRQRWQASPAHYEALFDAVGALVLQVRTALAQGDIPALGILLNANQALLEPIGVSSTELDRLVAAARMAGALGAKLSGAGWGGVMLALVAPTTRERVAAALRAAGVVHVLETAIERYTAPAPAS